MKKFSLFLAVLLTIGMLAGCGEQSATTETTLAPTTAAPSTEPTTIPTTAPTQPAEPVVIDFELALPEGFDLTVMQDTIQVFSSPKSPRDPSQVIVEVYPKDESVLTMDTPKMTDRIMNPVVQHVLPEESSFPTEATESTETTAPEDVPEPFVKELESAKVDGWDAVFTDYVQSYDDYTTHVYRYEVVTTDANYVFSFCDSTDNNDWLEEFKKSAENINLILDTEGMELDYSGLTHYDLPSGLKLYAEADLKPQDAKGFTDALANRNVLILTMADDKVTNNLTQMTLKDYADLVATSNQLEPFQEDMYGTLFTTFYSTDDAGLKYYNMICVKETEDDFWVCQMTCLANDQVRYAKEFALWASSIS